MLDFSQCQVDITKIYGGAKGKKKAIMWKGARFMLKFPPPASKNPEMSYANSCISEYVACHIVESLGLLVQETHLGMYGDKVVVACKDFTANNCEFVDFIALKNSVLEVERSGGDTGLSETLIVLEKQQIVDVLTLKRFFWDMFVADTLLGNFDRHNGNFGFLKDLQYNSYKIAPIFDCGSCLFPQADTQIMQKVLDDPKELEKRVFTYPLSALKDDKDKKINPYNFLMTTDNIDCLNALVRVTPRIDMAKICAIVDETPAITQTQREFLKTIVQARKDCILDPAYTRALDKTCQNTLSHTYRL
ncbi:HipA domain-containing protein [Helicobacter labacensis]|uniref:HipA domain-containing protein n=1 Tax=Helicobacter labacensis TaxID=2316079 RepID=UPI000EABD12F|nr:HipA domain-containing protein [Helicobacter labacensis]